MSLASLFQQLAQDMLTPGRIMDDVPIEAIYQSMGVPTFNTETQEVTENPLEYPITGVPDKPSQHLVDNINIFATDKWFCVAGKTFREAGLTVENKPDDVLIFQDETWTVVRIHSDPVQAVFIIEVRKP